MNRSTIDSLSLSRKRLVTGIASAPAMKGEEEGGCGVVGFCCSEPVAARHIYEPSKQMHNRGNGKGGGIAALGLIPEQIGVTKEIIESCYMLHIAFLDPGIRPELERKYITSYFDVIHSQKLATVEDWTSVPDLEVKPPDVWRYLVKVKSDILNTFISSNSLQGLSRDEAEAEFINQNSIKLNQEFYASLGEQKGFVMSQGKDIMILKVVGYAEAITKYYKISDLKAHIWIAHQRFPTKGRVWHPGGAHPFGAINTALVHNGDFANYASVCEYLSQRHIYPQFLTDTEVSVQIFDLLKRTYNYPLEYIIEAMAPTSELDFDKLPKEKQLIYRKIQAAHIHGSPDGPWFFIIARSIPEAKKFQLMGITDTAMLRPQVFAFSDGEVQVGLIGSEKQAIDATLLSLSKDDSRICPIADRYWNARGGSYNDGGAFIFELNKSANGRIRITCTDKFGAPVKMPAQKEVADFSMLLNSKHNNVGDEIRKSLESGDTTELYEYYRRNMVNWKFDEVREALNLITELAEDPKYTAIAIEVLTSLNDRKYATGTKKRNHVVYFVRESLKKLFNSLPKLEENSASPYKLIDLDTRQSLRSPKPGEMTLVINAMGFPPEGSDCDAELLVKAYMSGWKHFITYGLCGQRFHGCGLGPETQGVTIDIFDSSGDYLGSGIDGLTITVHGNAQDQLGQIIKSGKLVIHGDVGQTFMYGAKGGTVYVMGNAAGRPLINSVGRPRVIINGTCLDFLAESFMAGDALNGGGFVILNAITYDDDGCINALKEPYPGSNIFSLASGGAIYIRDPKKCVVDQQLNGGEFAPLADEDWELILPYLEENERLFDIKINDLLTVDGKQMPPTEVYRKIQPVRLAQLASTKAAPVESTEIADDDSN
jgi:glutamate synthase domain-containing protein 1/glutamate synthase domain-containing protein 3